MSILQNFPNTRPSVSINFARSKRLDPRITFTRTSSGTRTNSQGLVEVVPANFPRFDHDPVTGECLGLMIEEQRINLHPQSANFNFSATSNTTEIDVFNPDGTAAIRRIPLSTGNFHGTGAGAANIDITNLAIGGTIDVTTSIFVRNYNNSNLRLLIGFAAYDGTTHRYLLGTINTATPTTLPTPSATGWSNGSTEVENYANGWYRYTFSGRYTKETGYNSILFVGEQILSNTGQQFWFGDDVSGIYVWGTQRELGLFSTSYIPTSGSTVTRTADNARITGTNFSSWYNPNEGTLLTNVNLPVRIPTGARSFALDDGTTAYMMDLTNTLNTFTLEGLENSSYVNIISISNSTSKIVKQATSFNSSSQTISVNGEVTSPSSTSLSINRYSNLRIGTQVNNAAYLNGYIQQLTYYPVRLPNQILQNLTK